MIVLEKYNTMDKKRTKYYIMTMPRKCYFTNFKVFVKSL